MIVFNNCWVLYLKENKGSFFFFLFTISRKYQKRSSIYMNKDLLSLLDGTHRKAKKVKTDQDGENIAVYE